MFSGRAGGPSPKQLPQARVMVFSNFLPPRRAVAGTLYKQLLRAGCAMLIYTAFTNLICNKEITYGRDK
jgi:hypothetical protein